MWVNCCRTATLSGDNASGSQTEKKSFTGLVLCFGHQNANVSKSTTVDVYHMLFNVSEVMLRCVLYVIFFIEKLYLFGVLRCFQHCTGHITTGSCKGRGNQYIQLVKVLYYKLPTISKQLPAFPLEVRAGMRTLTSEVGGERVTTLPPWPN